MSITKVMDLTERDGLSPSEGDYVIVSNVLGSRKTYQYLSGSWIEMNDVAIIEIPNEEVNNTVVGSTVACSLIAPPDAINDSYTVTSYTATDLDVLSNDSDPLGQTITVISVDSPVNGQAVIKNTSEVTYTSNQGFTGNDSFNYTIQDEDGLQDIGTVDIVVNDTVAPVANNNSYSSLYRDQAIDLDVLDNDIDNFGQGITIQSFTQPSSGTVSQTGQQLRYTPDGTAGSFSFTYTIVDGNLKTDTATVTLGVLNLDVPAPPPVITVNYYGWTNVSPDTLFGSGFRNNKQFVSARIDQEDKDVDIIFVDDDTIKIDTLLNQTGQRTITYELTSRNIGSNINIVENGSFILDIEDIPSLNETITFSPMFPPEAGDVSGDHTAVKLDNAIGGNVGRTLDFTDSAGRDNSFGLYTGQPLIDAGLANDVLPFITDISNQQNRDVDTWPVTYTVGIKDSVIGMSILDVDYTDLGNNGYYAYRRRHSLILNSDSLKMEHTFRQYDSFPDNVRSTTTKTSVTPGSGRVVQLDPYLNTYAWNASTESHSYDDRPGGGALLTSQILHETTGTLSLRVRTVEDDSGNPRISSFTPKPDNTPANIKTYNYN